MAMSTLEESWTVLLYMGADGEQEAALDVGVFNDLREVRSVLPTKRVNVGVQLDLKLFPPARFTIDPAGGFGSVQRLRESSTGSPRTLFGFLKWGLSTLEARHFALVLWGHGLGVGHFARMVSSQADSVYDGFDGLHVREAAGALEKFAALRGTKLEILGFDACLMSAAELAHEVRDSVEYMVSSQVTLPVETGWPYEPILTRLRRSPGLTPGRFATLIVDDVVRSYRPQDNVTQTMIDTQGSECFTAAFKALTAALTAAIGDDKGLRAVRKAIHKTAHSEVREFLDVEDLCRQLRRHAPTRAVRQAAAQVLSALPQLVRAHKRKGRRVSRLHGASVYCRNVPDTPDTLSVVVRKDQQRRNPDESRLVSLTDDRYRKLQFAKDTGWPAFMDRLETRLGSIRRPRRPRRGAS
jgi:hypothetical protein